MSEINFRMSGEGHKVRVEEIAACRTEPGQQFFTHARGVVSSVVGGETLIVPLRGKVGGLASIYSFSGAGSLIWQLLDVPRDLPELIAAVEQESGVGRERAQRDVTQFLNDMLSVGLVEIGQRVAVSAMEMTATGSTGQVLWEPTDSR
jgi:hypothetical protein